MRIAIVNDLALAREVLRRLVLSVPGYSVAWTAADGAEAVRKASADRPDVILMDLVMPVMDGAEATRRIMASSPCPVLVVTASLGANFGKVYEALGAGGLDAVKTPVLGPGGRVCGGEALLERLARLARSGHVPGESPARATQAGTPTTLQAGLPLLAIGASTGGPEALARVLRALAPAPPAPVVVVQHIASDFAPGLAAWLQGRASVPVCVAREGDAPGPGQVYLAGRDEHLVLGPDRRFAYTEEPKANPYRPSVDELFDSLASAWPAGGVAVLLTGMRDDGARGLARLRQLGWHTIAQDRQTCVVYGMPKAAVELNAAVEVLPLPAIGPAALARLRGRCG